MNCPRCGSIGRITHTRRRIGYLERLRKYRCPSCEFRFTTVEMYADAKSFIPFTDFGKKLRYAVRRWARQLPDATATSKELL